VDQLVVYGGQFVKLTAKKVERATPGKHGGGDGLWLHVATSERCAWVFRYQRHGKAHTMGLGAFPTVSLAEARDKATEARQLLAAGIDPLGPREAARQAEAAEQAQAITFADAASAYITAHEPGGRSDKHRAGWRGAIKTHAAQLHAMPCSAIETADVLKVLQPIWNTKPETASRPRGRIEMVLCSATARGWSQPGGVRPPGTAASEAQQGCRLCTTRDSIGRKPLRMAELQKHDGMAARASAFAILTAARSGEVRSARWDEIGLTRAIWTVPGSADQCRT